MPYIQKQPFLLLGLALHSVEPIIALINIIRESLSPHNTDNHLSILLAACTEQELGVVVAYLKTHAKVSLSDTDKLNGLLEFLIKRINCELHDRIIDAHDDDFDFISAKSINILSIFEELERHSDKVHDDE